MDDEYKIINSPLSQKITRDGTTIDVRIYRGEHEAEWILEVVDHAGGSTVWDDTFATEQDALNEVLRTIDENRLLQLRSSTERSKFTPSDGTRSPRRSTSAWPSSIFQ